MEFILNIINNYQIVCRVHHGLCSALRNIPFDPYYIPEIVREGYYPCSTLDQAQRGCNSPSVSPLVRLDTGPSFSYSGSHGFLCYVTHNTSLRLKTSVFLLNFHFIMVATMMIIALYQGFYVNSFSQSNLPRATQLVSTTQLVISRAHSLTTTLDCQ